MFGLALRRIFLMLLTCTSLMLSACENDNPTQIEWMIPMQPSNDKHTNTSLTQAVPEWAVKEGMAVDVIILSKFRAQRWNYHLGSDTVIHHRGLTVELLGISQHLRIGKQGYIEDAKVNNPAAFIRVLKHDHLIYQGWIYQEFPELFGLEDPEWQIWLKHVEPAS
jgi:hypothetical protein